MRTQSKLPKGIRVFLWIVVILFALMIVIAATSKKSDAPKTDLPVDEPAKTEPARTGADNPSPVPASPETDPEPKKEPDPEPEVERITLSTLSGTGDSVSDSMTFSEPSAVRLRFDAERYVSVRAFYGDGKYDYESLFNEIGPFDGEAYLPAGTYDLVIEAASTVDWQLEFETIGKTSETAFSGSGNTVSKWFVPESNKYRITHDGSHYFSVSLRYGTGKYDYDMPVNEIGSYSGTVRLDTSGVPCFLIVNADGDWTFEPAN